MNFTEVMGRTSLINYQPTFYDPMDFFRYSSAGVRSLAPPQFVFINNGTTHLATWNNNTFNGDLVVGLLRSRATAATMA